MSRARKRRSPQKNAGSGYAVAWAGKSENITSLNVLSTGLQEAITAGKKRWRIVTTFDANGRIEPIVYVADNRTHRVLAVPADELATMARTCPDPVTAAHLRGLHEQFRAESHGQVGHA